MNRKAKTTLRAKSTRTKSPTKLKKLAKAQKEFEEMFSVIAPFVKPKRLTRKHEPSKWNASDTQMIDFYRDNDWY